MEHLQFAIEVLRVIKLSPCQPDHVLSPLSQSK